MADLDRLRALLQGDLVTPGSPDYEAARRPAFARFDDVRPRAVVRCASVRDVVDTITYVRDSGIAVAPRGGGHCFAGRSTIEGVMLDLGQLSSVAVAPDGRARIGAGARLARVYDALDAHHRAIPAGCGPTVGIAGLTLGGGLGLLGRRYGLTCDVLTAAEVVLADGRVVRCGADREPELFWALRGSGGGQFGVVTELEFATVPEPRVTRVELCWSGDAAAVVAAWLDWAPHAAGEITVNLSVAVEPGRPLEVTAFGAALRDRDATSALLDGLVSRVGGRPESRLRDDLTVRYLKRSFAPADEPAALTTRSRSELFTRPLPPSTVTALLDELCAGPLEGRRELAFTALGGAYDEVAPDATAYAHRGARFLLEHVGEDGSAWVDRSWAVAHPHGTGGVYANFPDPQLADATAYHGDNHARLVAAKRAYDPDRLFDFPQAI